MPQAIRVAYINHIAQLSGGEIALARLIAALPEQIEPVVILAEDGPLRPVLESAGAAVSVLPMDESVRNARKDALSESRGSAALSLARYVQGLSSHLRHLKVDVVHTNSLKAGYYGTVAARLSRRPVVWHVRDRIANDYLSARTTKLTRAALHYLPSAILCNSGATAKTVLAKSGRRLTPTVVHDPYEPRFAPAPPPSSDFTCGIVGRLTPWKGQDVALRAFATAFPDGSARLRVVGSAMFGEDRYADALRTQADALGLTDRVDFVGQVDDIEAELAGLHVLIHASIIPEPFGQVVVEGMAAGRAVIAAAAGGPTEIVTDGVDGLLTAPGDAAELSQALLRLHGNPAERVRLSERAIIRAADFGPEKIGLQVAALYQRLLAK